MKKLYYLIIILFSASSYLAFSQKTGSFNINITLATGNRPLCFYVPKDYDSTKKYSLMICLHGSGQPAASYRDNLCPGLASFIMNTIFVCPEGGGPSGDFYNQPGDEAIIDSALSYTKARYSIDEKNIILQGFSLGGRSALKYGLEHPDIFKGLFLNTPAVQSNLDVNNVSPFTLGYHYENAGKVAIAITHGADDQGYYHLDDTLYKRLTDANGIVYFTRIQGMQHAIPGKTIIQKCLAFIDNPLADSLDADITNIMSPDIVYEKKISPSIRFRNTGKSKINSAVFSYSINDVPASSDYSWNGSLNSFEKVDVLLPEIPCSEDNNIIKVTIKNINGNNVDSADSTKTISSNFQCLSESLNLPVNFGFEFDEPYANKWNSRFSGGMWTWGVYTDAKSEGNNAGFMYNIPLFNPNLGLSDDILSPVVNLTSVQDPCIKFDYAYNYFDLSIPVWGMTTITDTLHILMSTDCGKTFKDIFTKSGADLATTTSPMSPSFTNLNLNEWMYIPASTEEWKSEVIKITGLGEEVTNAFFVFKYVSGLGGSLWLDNIRIGSYEELAGIADNQESSLIKISPNPVTDYINITFPENVRTINIFDNSGRNIYSKLNITGENELHISTNEMTNGIYFVEINTGSKTYRQKFVVSK